jgi:hypothetical protein
LRSPPIDDSPAKTLTRTRYQRVVLSQRGWGEGLLRSQKDAQRRIR